MQPWLGLTVQQTLKAMNIYDPFYKKVTK